jgi:alcohol dehydrogenase YqhD (iron-dependent ADH family)
MGLGVLKKSGFFDRVIKSLEDVGIEVQELPGVKPIPA